ncbi:MAG: hypothetical protein M1826_007241 [Phylliscum demangeonii]|nr:MAG: hypothetical protein M1826_007241 [Phylliscum demangeonii]
MPFLPDHTPDLAHAAHQIILSASDAEYIDQLIPAIKQAASAHRTPQLLRALAAFTDQREKEIQSICSSNHEEFVTSVNRLLEIREKTAALTLNTLGLHDSIQASAEKLAQHKKGLVDSRSVRHNIDDATHALHEGLDVLRQANHVYDLLGKKNHYGALRALDELVKVHLKQIRQYQLAQIIQRSIPATQKLIAQAVMADLTTWLYQIRVTSQFLGDVAFHRTGLRRTRLRDRIERTASLERYRLNSAIELVADETVDFDVLDNEDVQVDFTPLFECLHIHHALGQSDKFRVEYAATRRQQKELLLPASITLSDDEDASLMALLEGIAGFAIVEKATMHRVQNLRSPVDVEELWDSMCSTAIVLISKALDSVETAEALLKINGIIALFLQTMARWGYSVHALDSFLLTLFEKYAELLKRKFSSDFQEIVSSDDYMPMPITNLDQYDKVVNVSWYEPDKAREDLRFPCVLPFSQMYPLCCIDIRNFLNKFYFFSDDHFQHRGVIDDTLKTSLDELLTDSVCRSLVERLQAKNLGQIVQILINLEYFVIACQELEELLLAARSSTVGSGPIALKATDAFRSNMKVAEQRIFELVNSKVDDLIDSAEYNWMSTATPTEPSSYIQTLTGYLSNIMNSTLLSLPREIKELIYFNTLSHVSARILALPLSSEVKKINPHGVTGLAKDVEYLVHFVDGLHVPILKENLDELQQTVLLMQAEHPDEYYDVASRNKKYGRVDAVNGPVLLEKLTYSVQSTSINEKLSALSSRLGMKS